MPELARVPARCLGEQDNGCQRIGHKAAAGLRQRADPGNPAIVVMVVMVVMVVVMMLIMMMVNRMSMDCRDKVGAREEAKRIRRG